MKMAVISVIIGAPKSVPKSLVRWGRNVGNWRKNREHPNDSIVKIDQNTEESPGDLRRFVMTNTPVKDHQLTLVWKTFKEENNNNNNNNNRGANYLLFIDEHIQEELKTRKKKKSSHDRLQKSIWQNPTNMENRMSKNVADIWESLDLYHLSNRKLLTIWWKINPSSGKNPKTYLPETLIIFTTIC